jgi:hypothetical protein
MLPVSPLGINEESRNYSDMFALRLQNLWHE